MKKKTLKRRIQEQFWSFGHKAKDMAGVPGITYDLLVDDKIRVKIIDAEKEYTREGCDVLALEYKGDKKYAMVPKGPFTPMEWQTQTEAFGKKKQA